MQAASTTQTIITDLYPRAKTVQLKGYTTDQRTALHDIVSRDVINSGTSQYLNLTFENEITADTKSSRTVSYLYTKPQVTGTADWIEKTIADYGPLNAISFYIGGHVTGALAGYFDGIWKIADNYPDDFTYVANTVTATTFNPRNNTEYKFNVQQTDPEFKSAVTYDINNNPAINTKDSDRDALITSITNLLNNVSKTISDASALNDTNLKNVQVELETASELSNIGMTTINDSIEVADQNNQTGNNNIVEALGGVVQRGDSVTILGFLDANGEADGVPVEIAGEGSISGRIS